jgi:hypothetical protein
MAKNYDVTEEELDDLFSSSSNDLKSEAIKALKNSSKSVPMGDVSVAVAEKSEPKTKVQEEVKVPKKKKHQVGISHRTDLGDDRDYSYRDGGGEEDLPEKKQEVVEVEDDDLDAILGVDSGSFMTDDSEEKSEDHIDSFMNDVIEVEESFDEEDEKEYEDDTNKKSWDPEEDDEGYVGEDDEAEAMDKEPVGEDDFDFDDGDVDLPDDFDNDDKNETEDIEDEQVKETEEKHESCEEDEVEEEVEADEVAEALTKVSSEAKSLNTEVENDFIEEGSSGLRYDEMSFLDKMRLKITESGLCKRASYLEDSDLFDFYIEKFETVKYCKVHAPDFDMEALRKELEQMIVPIFDNKIISLDEINMKLQKVQAFRNRAVEIKLVFLKNYTSRCYL